MVKVTGRAWAAKRGVLKDASRPAAMFAACRAFVYSRERTCPVASDSQQ